MYLIYNKRGKLVNTYDYLPSGYQQLSSNVAYDGYYICGRVSDGEVETYNNGCIHYVGGQEFEYYYYDGYEPVGITHIYSNYGSVSFEYYDNEIAGIYAGGAYYSL